MTDWDKFECKQGHTTCQWRCGRDGKRPAPMDVHELDGVRMALPHYKSDELVARLLATIDWYAHVNDSPLTLEKQP